MVSEREELFNWNKDKFIDSPLFYKGKAEKGLIEDVEKSRIVIYTAFTGDYDSLKDPDFIDDNCDYVCFTDNPNIKSNIWKIIPMEDSNLDNNRKAKQYKVLPHKHLAEYKYSFWIDASFKITGSIREYACKYLKNPMLNVIHDERFCVYDEAIVSAGLDRYPSAILEKQTAYYEKQGFPHNYGLVSCGIIFREHSNPKIIELMEDWWSEILKYTNQDQVSFSYVCWKNDFHPSVSNVYTWNNEYWIKCNEYIHNTILTNSRTADNLIERIESGKTSISNLEPCEIQLLYNDLSSMIYDEDNPMNFIHGRLFVYQNGREYALLNAYQRFGKNTLKFDLKPFESIDSMSFVPAPRGFVKCEILSFESNCKDLKITGGNCINNPSEKMQTYCSSPPEYEIEGNFSNIEYIEITFMISPVFKNELENRIHELKLETEILKNKNKELENRTNELTKETEILRNKNKKLENRTQELTKENKTLKNKNEKLKNRTNKLTKENKTLKNKNKELEKKYKEILNSNSWKATKPLRSLKNSLNLK